MAKKKKQPPYKYHPDLTMGLINNEQRSDWAEEAVMVFAESTGMSRNGELVEDLVTTVGDLICDLMHLAGSQGLDPEELMAKAYENGRGNFLDESIAANHEGPEPLKNT